MSDLSENVATNNPMRLLIIIILGSMLILAYYVSTFFRSPVISAYSGNPFHESWALRRATELIGLTKDEVIAKLDQPSKEQMISLRDANSEFRSHLLNYYSRNYNSNLRVRFIEIWWISAERNLTVWFHWKDGNWTVLEACDWDSKLQF